MARSKRSSRRIRSMRRRRQSGGLLQMLGGKAFSKEDKSTIFRILIFNIITTITLINLIYKLCNLVIVNRDITTMKDDYKQILDNHCLSKNNTIFNAINALNILISIISIINIDNIKLASALCLFNQIIILLDILYFIYIEKKLNLKIVFPALFYIINIIDNYENLYSKYL